MPLPTVAQMIAYTDKLAISYERMITPAGSASGSVTAGTWRNLSNNLATLLTTAGDLDQAVALASSIQTLLAGSNVSVTQSTVGPVLSAIRQLCANLGATVNVSIVDLPTYLAYYNGGGGGAAYSSMLHPSFGKMHSLFQGVALPPAGLFHPGIHPALDPVNYPFGFGTCTYANAVTLGASASPLYSDPLPFVEVTASFVGGSAHPVVTVTGTDDTGLTAQTWTANLGTNNPAASLSTTFNGAQTADSKASVLVASSTGFIVGNVVILGTGTVNQETAVVLAIPDGTHLTLEMRNPHASGETITANLAFVLTPGVSGARINSVSAIAISGGGGWTAGAVRVYGGQLRMGNPVN